MRVTKIHGRAVLASSGFTLLELMVTVAIAAILASIAAPNFRNLLLNNARASTVNDLVAALHQARVESQKQGRDAVVCPLNAAGTCEPSTTNWNNGWLIYVNMDTTTPPAFDAADMVVQQYAKSASSITIKADQIQFFFRPSPAGGISGGIKFCDPRGAAESREVLVARSGKIHTVGNVSCS